MKRLEIPQKLVYKKIYVHKKIYLDKIAADLNRDCIKIQQAY